jgi:hypothetical protein
VHSCCHLQLRPSCGVRSAMMVSRCPWMVPPPQTLRAMPPGAMMALAGKIPPPLPSFRSTKDSSPLSLTQPLALQVSCCEGAGSIGRKPLGARHHTEPGALPVWPLYFGGKGAAVPYITLPPHLTQCIPCTLFNMAPLTCLARWICRWGQGSEGPCTNQLKLGQ